MPYLIQKKLDGTMVQQWQLGEHPVVVGRGKDVDVKVDDPEMSKRHFCIEYKGGNYYVRDLNSVNGTWINKRPIVEEELKPGERIRAGQTLFAFEKGLGTVIGELAKEDKSYKTALKEITKSIGPGRQSS